MSEVPLYTAQIQKNAKARKGEPKGPKGRENAGTPEWLRSPTTGRLEYCSPERLRPTTAERIRGGVRGKGGGAARPPRSRPQQLERGGALLHHEKPKRGKVTRLGGVLPTFAKEQDVETTWGEGEKGGCLTAPQKNEKGGCFTVPREREDVGGSFSIRHRTHPYLIS